MFSPHRLVPEAELIVPLKLSPPFPTDGDRPPNPLLETNLKIVQAETLKMTYSNK
jgi:hypothetical protein